MTITLFTAEALITRYSHGYVAVSEKLTGGEWCVRVFKDRIGGERLIPEDGSTLTFCTQDGFSAAQGAMEFLGVL